MRAPYRHTNAHTHTGILAIKKNEFAISSNLDGPKEYCTELNKVDREQNTV